MKMDNVMPTADIRGGRQWSGDGFLLSFLPFLVPLHPIREAYVPHFYLFYLHIPLLFISLPMPKTVTRFINGEHAPRPRPQHHPQPSETVALQPPKIGDNPTIDLIVLTTDASLSGWAVLIDMGAHAKLSS